MNERPRRRSSVEDDEVGWIATLGLIAIPPLTGCLAVIYVMSMVELGPVVGDIVAFQPGRDRQAPGLMRVTATHVPNADQAASVPPKTCVLDPSVLRDSGGSFVVETKTLSRPPTYRVHWAGPRTAPGKEDCGKSADLALDLRDLRALAQAAGGIGIVPRSSGL